MASCTNEPSPKDGNPDYQNVTPPTVEIPSKPDNYVDEEAEDEEDEEEDVDFNPFLKETPSPEASSSLSSDVEGLDGVVDSKGGNYYAVGDSLKLTGKLQNCDDGDLEHGEEEVLMQSNLSSEGASEKGRQEVFLRNRKRNRSDLILQTEIESSREKEDETSCGVHANVGAVGELSNTTKSERDITNLGDEDAICMRTRARYSLASFTLDELEAFLQETDDDDDLQNADDEEEYRKFLSAVLQGGNNNEQLAQDNYNGDDDEDNDADFEIELEEALESDYDGGITDKTRTSKYERTGRRPETRQNRQQKSSAHCKRKLLAHAKRPLRPLLPILPNRPIAPIPTSNAKALVPNIAPTREDGLRNGFTPNQIGQLYCLIHEHVQLLIQIFSLCVLDPSRQYIATQVQGLIFEMLCKRKELVACRSEAHPDFCFSHPYICSSVLSEVPQVSPVQCVSGSSSKFDSQGVVSPNTQIPTPQNIFTSEGRYDQHFNGTAFQAVGCWMPVISGPVFSVMDVAALNLVGKYMDDVCTAVQEYHRRHVESSCDNYYEREPLFPLPCLLPLAEANSFRGSSPPTANPGASSSSQQPRKTLAATLVESSKKQSVALVPKEIAKLAQRFFPLFNPSLFPHKPPPAAVANRVLFTDSEDELLALGLMEYNSDWKAIQQRYLPCKSKHQIFVRQKNRCSSKASENPIKAVRRMKTSPLTAEEIGRIQEGLGVFKLDWMSVWKFIVPYRDPSLLPRQWRIALGTQKSYKQDAAKKEKRRVYESRKRKSKATLANWQLASDKEDYQAEIPGAENYSGNDNAEIAGDAYVHEAFLADWRPGMSYLISSANTCTNNREQDLPNDTPPGVDTDLREQPETHVSGEAQPSVGNMHRIPCGLNYSVQPSSHISHDRQTATINMLSNHLGSGITSGTSKPQIFLRPYRARRSTNQHLVRLAPDLPPVNLPPTVRVISQSVFKSNQLDASTKPSVAQGSIGDGGGENTALLPHVVKSGAASSVKAKTDTDNPVREHMTNSCQDLEESGHVKEKHVQDKRGTDPEFQMHPLLFQSTGDRHLRYHSLDRNLDGSSSFSFFSENRPQLNLSLFHNSNQTTQVVDCLNKAMKIRESNAASVGVDFHPLLQRNDNKNSNLLSTCTSPHPYVQLEGRSSQLHSPDAVKKFPVSCPFTVGSKHSSPNVRANDLDLEIHLSSASIKEKDTLEIQKTCHLSHQHTDSSPAACSKLLPGITGSVAPSNDVGRCNMEDVSDQSHLEIVMEQEELSDSDEEIEEHVEFECEEMADSEGESGSGCEQIDDAQNKEVPDATAEKAGSGADSDGGQQEPGILSQPQGNTPALGNGGRLRLGLTELGKDPTNHSWLSLDPCAAAHVLCKKTEHENNVTIKDSAMKNLVSCRASRSCKKTLLSTKKVAASKQVTEMALSLGPLASLKKRKKRASRANASLNSGMYPESKDKYV